MYKLRKAKQKQQQNKTIADINIIILVHAESENDTHSVDCFDFISSLCDSISLSLFLVHIAICALLHAITVILYRLYGQFSSLSIA